MKQTWLLLCTLLALPAAVVASEGSWSASAAGGTTHTGKQLLRSRPLHSPSALSPDARIAHFSWRITLLAPPPPGLQIKLCRIDKCSPLPTLAGERSVAIPLSAVGEFRFIYFVNRVGRLQPPLNVVRNQLTVNYH